MHGARGWVLLAILPHAALTGLEGALMAGRDRAALAAFYAASSVFFVLYQVRQQTVLY